MKVTIRLVLCLLLVATAASGIQAEEFHNALSFQGYTGLLNTPSAYVTELGKFYMSFTDEVERNRRSVIERGENYLISIGALPFCEVSARLTEEHPAGRRDLSANAKIQIPVSLFYQNPYLPEIAVGMADIGGGAQNFQTRYAVLSKEIHPFRFSLGYGHGPDRMKGVFGGAEVQITKWCYIVGEYDTDETNVGLRLVTPDLFGFPVNIGLAAKMSLDHKPDEADFQVLFQFPLGLGRDKRKAIAEDKQKPVVKKTLGGKIIEPASPIRPKTDSPEVIQRDLKKLKEKLTELGFENVEVGITDPAILYVAYENNRYNHNELDGLGLVLGVASTMAPPSLESLMVVIKEVNIRILELSAPVSACQSFLTASKATDSDVKAFSDKMTIRSETTDSKDIRLIGGDDNLSRFKPRILLYPGLSTMIGSELGVLDYLLSLKTDVQVPLWKGGVLNAVWDIPVAWSDDYDDDRKVHFGDNGFMYSMDSYTNKPRIESLMIHQAFKVTPDILTQFSAGLYLKDLDGFNNIGALNETVWRPGNGNHRLKLRAGYFKDDRKDEEMWDGYLFMGRHSEDYERKILLGSYRYYWDRPDLSIEATYGKYWHQDTGLTLEVERFFGDASVSLFYQNVGDEPGSRAAGIRISLPLTPRRDMKPRWVQVRGSEHWTYQYRKTIVGSGEWSPQNSNLAIIPETTHHIDRIYFNQDRLNESYIRNHLWRLRDAYITWKE